MDADVEFSGDDREDELSEFPSSGGVVFLPNDSDSEEEQEVCSLLLAWRKLNRLTGTREKEQKEEEQAHE